MQTAFLIILATLGLFDLAFSSDRSIAPVALLFVFLNVQANMAAARFLREGLKNPDEPFEYPEWYTGAPKKEKKAEKPPEMVNVIPLSQARKRQAPPRQDPPRQDPPRQEPSREKPKVARETPKAQPTVSATEKTKPFFQLPKFTGQPHEVLGIQENAATRLIVQAFRHWIKRYHPDHASQRAAAEQTRQLTSAKESLLEKRKRMREHRAA